MMVLTRRQARLLSLTDPAYRVRKFEGRWWVVDENGSVVEFPASIANEIIMAPAGWVRVVCEPPGRRVVIENRIIATPAQADALMRAAP